MAINYAKFFRRFFTPQSEPISDTTQVRNSAGGYTWALDDWGRLDRFLILGAEGGTFYLTERDLVKQNHDAVVNCIRQDGVRVVQRAIEISTAGRAPKNDPAIFVLALVTAHGETAAKALAFASLGEVCRTGTHLFHFAEYVNALRGWGRGLRKAVGRWYTGREAEELAFQAVKYRQRDGWSHADLLRLVHPKAPTREHDAVFRWVLTGAESLGEREVKRRIRGVERPVKYGAVGELPKLITAFEEAKRATSRDELVRLITAYNLPWEAVPTPWLSEAAVWEALLPRLPLTALVRNLGRLTAIGLVKPASEAAAWVVRKLGDEVGLKRARLHPLAILIAQKVYAQGHGDPGSLRWVPVTQVTDALDAAFYAAFQSVEPCGRPVLLALDVSGSMGTGSVAGSALTPREASAALALVTAATEPECHIMGFSDRFMPLNISPRQRLDDVVKHLGSLPFQATDCALPMVWAREHGVNVSAFVTYTDSETWAGAIHPSQALRQYRGECVGGAKSVVVGMTSNGFTIADPNDRGMLDVVGFDAAVPAVIADFIRS